MGKMQGIISWIPILRRTHIFFLASSANSIQAATCASELKEYDQWHVLTNPDTKIFRAAIKRNFLLCIFLELISRRRAFNTYVLELGRNLTLLPTTDCSHETSRGDKWASNSQNIHLLLSMHVNQELQEVKHAGGP